MTDERDIGTRAGMTDVIGSALTPEILEDLKASGRLRRLGRGDVLVEQGSAADAFYIVISGRFHVMVKGRPIAEIAAGEPIGEIAFFAGGTRTANVVAARASEVLEITKAAYSDLARRHPEIPASLIAALAERLRRGVPASQSLSPLAGEIVGILPAAGGRLDAAFVRRLLAELTGGSAPMVALGPEDLSDGQSISDWLSSGRADGRQVVLTCPDPQATPGWADEIVENADTLLLVLDRRAGSAAAVSPLEERVGAKFLTSSVHLAILWPGESPVIQGTTALLQGRSPGLHHHVREGAEGDIARLARFLRGDAMGIVFGGGGAFGTAHLAIIKALQERGFAFDIAGGASIGASMAAIYAMGLDPDEAIDRFDQLFIKAGVMKRLTVPRYSIIDHKHFDAQIAIQYEGRRIEDLPINYFAVSTSLTRNDLVVLRQGELWRTARASSSIPAVFPPIVTDDGEVLIDGAYVDNVPVDTMRRLKPGRNLVLSLAAKQDWRVETDYDALPGRGRLAAQFMTGGLMGRVRFPGIFSIMTRSMIVNSERRLATLDRRDDVFLSLPPLKGMGFLDWAKARTLFDATYRSAVAALDAAEKSGGDGDLLAEFARRMMGEGAA